MSDKKAVVLLSGGLDSATVLAMARAQDYQCYALSMDYGQRCQLELEGAKKVAQAHGAIQHHVVKIDIGVFGGSALTDESIDVPVEDAVGTENKQIPITYVPARNTVFLSVALGWAEVLDAQAIFIGANAVDYSGYPDCRAEYLQAFQTMANLATKTGVEGGLIEIKAPILKMSKDEIIRTGLDLGVDYSLTMSCYNPDDGNRACGECDSCRIRQAGFAEAGVADPAS